jgi:hypothetical protein
LRDQHIDGLRALVYFQSGLFEAAIKYALKNAIDYVNYDGHDPYLLAFAYQQVDDIESMNPLLGILRKNQKSY